MTGRFRDLWKRLSFAEQVEACRKAKRDPIVMAFMVSAMCETDNPHVGQLWLRALVRVGALELQRLTEVER